MLVRLVIGEPTMMTMDPTVVELIVHYLVAVMELKTPEKIVTLEPTQLDAEDANSLDVVIMLKMLVRNVMMEITSMVMDVVPLV